ncbi:MAG: hypothetical protein ABL932_23210, partial [Terricaulis sp.]
MRSIYVFVALASFTLAEPASAQDAQPAPAQRSAGAGTVDQASLEARVSTLLQREMRRCWRMPLDQPEPERLVVTVRFALNPDGSINGLPHVTQPANYTFDVPMQHAVQAALSAVRDCAPYTMLTEDPLLRDHQDLWDEVEMQFRVPPGAASRTTRNEPFDLAGIDRLLGGERQDRRQRQAIGPPQTVEDEVAYTLRQHIRACRTFVEPGPNSIPVVVSLRLNRNGTLRSRPTVLEPNRYRRDPETRAAVERT